MFIIPLPFPYLRTSTVHHNLMFVPNLRPSRCKWSYTEFIDTNKKLQFFGIIVCAQEALVVHIIKGQGPSSMSLDYTKLFQQHIQMKLNDKQKSYMLHSLNKACCMIGCWAAAVLQLACSDQWPQPGPGNFSNQSRSQEPEGGWRGQPPARAIRSQAPVTREWKQSGARNRRIMTSSSEPSGGTENSQALIILSVLWDGKHLSLS